MHIVLGAALPGDLGGSAWRSLRILMVTGTAEIRMK
jgi:hypothetical protein